MQRPPLHPFALLVILVACPLLSAVTLAGIAVGLASAAGATHAFVIGAVIAVTVFVVNSAALCMAVTRYEGDERTSALEAVETDVVARSRVRVS